MFQLDGMWFSMYNAVAYLERQGFTGLEAIAYIQSLYKVYINTPS